MSDSKSISFQEKDTIIHDLNPITKLFGMIWMVMMTFLVNGFTWPLILLLSLVIISLLAKSFVNVFRLVFLLISPILIFLSVVHGFLNPGNTTILYSFQVLNHTFELGKEGLMITYNLVSKLLLILPSVFLFVNTTSQEELMPNLIKKKVSPAISYLFLATLNVIPHMKTRMDTIKVAQEARGLVTDGNMIIRIKAFIPILMPLILSSLMDIHSRGITLEVRSFGVTRDTTSLYDLEEHFIDKLLQFISIFSLLVFVLYKIMISVGVF